MKSTEILPLEAFVYSPIPVLKISHSEIKAQVSYLLSRQQQIFWRRLWDIIVGREEEKVVKWEVVIFACLFYYSFTLLLCRILRRIARVMAPSELTPYLLDFATTFQVCACSLENAFVNKAYGRPYHMSALFCLGMWGSLTLGQTSGNPCVNLQRYLRAKLSLRQFAFRVCFQLSAALVAFKYARAWWAIGVTSQHALRAELITCTSDLRVSVVAGFVIEMFATAVDCMFGLVTFSSSVKYERFQQFAGVILGMIITLCGIHLTGMYINPANATTQTFGCAGSEPWEHIMVYWIGPFTGIWFSFRLYNRVRQVNLTCLLGSSSTPSTCVTYSVPPSCGETISEKKVRRRVDSFKQNEPSPVAVH